MVSKVAGSYLIAEYRLSNNDVKERNQRGRGERQARRIIRERRGDSRERRRRAGDPEPDPAILPGIYCVECYTYALGL